MRREVALAAVAISNRLPRAIARRAGRTIGYLAWLLARDERERALGRARVALGLSDRDARVLVRRCAVAFGGYLADALRLEVWSPAELAAVVRLDGIEHLRDVLTNGSGALVLSAHVGNWELLAAAIGASGVPFAVVGRRPDDPVLARRLAALRGRWGVATIWCDEGPRAILRALAAGRAVGVLVDQATDAPGGYVPFFGRPAWTPTGPARIALRGAVPVLPAHMTDAGEGYVGVIEPPLPVDGGAALAVTAAWTRHVEGWVRAAPHTWVWMHDRWREVAPRGSGSPGQTGRSRVQRDRAGSTVNRVARRPCRDE